MQLSAALLIALLAVPALAQEAGPPLPRARPEASEPVVQLPRYRPDAAQPAAPRGTGAGEVYGPPKPDEQAAEPKPPAEPRVYQTACPAVLQGRVEAEALPPIAEGQCVAPSPLSLTGVLANGRMVPVSGGVTTDCGMASALPGWVEAVDGYVAAREETRIIELVVGTSYMCRGVNGSGQLSFHGLADALDIVGFRLEDGRFATVEGGWADAASAEGRLLRFAHGAACAGFTTVLGPEANADHQDHLHLDLGCHGRSCTARICE